MKCSEGTGGCSRHPSLGLDPVEVVLGPGVSSRVADLTPSGGSEGHDSDLGPLVAGSLAAGLLDQGAAGVTVAGATTASGVNAHNAGSNDAVDGVTVGVGDHGQIPDLPQDGGDTAGAVGGLAPSGDGDQGSNGGSLASGGQARCGDVVVHRQRAGQLNEGQITRQVVGVPLGVGPAVVGGDLHTVGLAGLPDVVGSGHDIEVASTISAVSGGQDVVLRDDGATTEPGVIDEESHLPRPGVLSSLNTTNNPSLAGGALNATGSLGLASILVVGRRGSSPHLSGNLVDLDHEVITVGIDHGAPGLVLAEVTSLGGPPVLLRPQPAALRGRHGDGA